VPLHIFNQLNEIHSESEKQMSLIKLLKSMLLATGKLVISTSGKGFNLYGINPDTLDIDKINDYCHTNSIGMEAVLFPETNIPPSQPGEPWTTKPSSVYVGPPSDGSSDDELAKLIKSYQA
jgi:hypothetical protein